MRGVHQTCMASSLVNACLMYAAYGAQRHRDEAKRNRDAWRKGKERSAIEMEQSGIEMHGERAGRAAPSRWSEAESRCMAEGQGTQRHRDEAKRNRDAWRGGHADEAKGMDVFMSKTAVIAEKPSVGRDIARVLHCQKKINGGLEGGQYIVTWAMGHLVELKDPEDYDQKYKEWNMKDLPMLPEKMETKVISKTGGQYKAVRQILYRKDVENIVIATDAGREGELVARWILKQANVHKPCKRLWISSVTDKAIREGFSHLKDEKEYRNLYAAAAARAEADWLVGINATRALTCKYNAQLSCGRVQTPTLAMIAARENEIRKFQPETYYGLSVMAGGIQFTWKDKKSGSTRTFQKERIEEVRRKVEGKDLCITAVNTKVKKTFAPLLYDLTELQRDANVRFGYSAKETLNIMQRLYENHKVLTYPRTDSRYLTADVAGTIHERLEACAVGPYRKLAAPLMKKNFSGKQRFINDSKVSDHHAIIPTEQFVDLTHMTNEERRIYDLVVRRFLAVLYPAAEYEETSMTAEISDKAPVTAKATGKAPVAEKTAGKAPVAAKAAGKAPVTAKADGKTSAVANNTSGDIFAARGTRFLESGWRAVYEDPMDEDDDELELKSQKLPKISEGDVLPVEVAKATEGKTKPPARFTEATLLSAMENPIRYMESRDKEMVKTIGETGGLGTVATRADIIEKLFHSFLIEKKGKEIYTTGKARQLLELVPEDLKKPELTADWEIRLQKIAEGKLKSGKYLAEIRSYTEDLIGEIRTGDGTFRHENITNKICPQCGKRMLSVNGKNAKLLVCQDRECGYRETVSRTTNARCPNCHKKMEMVGKGEKATFVCACGYKERLSKFQERRTKEGKGVSKRDVAAYMRKQKKEAEEPLNNAFADAFKNIKL